MVVRLKTGPMAVELVRQNKKTVVVRVQNVKSVKNAEGKEELKISYKVIKCPVSDVISY